MIEKNISEFDVAVIGMACRFPKAKNIKQYWNNLLNGVNSTHFATEEELRDRNIPLDKTNDKHFIKASLPLEDIEQFDANFFQISPSDAVLMDPQIRGLLQTSWHTLEDAGYNSYKYKGAIGNFCSMGTGEYLHLLMGSAPALAARNPLLTRILNEKDFIATQISYKLNLKGPSMSVQTACSSSLLAVHLACQSLLSNESDMALAGGVQIDSSGSIGYTHTEGSILSPDGYCRAFDKDAQGTISGNGMGMILLKKLANAIDDGDHIYAVIKGSAANNDGADKMAYTAPNVDSQRDVILEALSVGEVEADTVELIEAHGTGTPLGDPVEVAALKEAFSQFTDRKHFCALGSVKTNIGHLDCAAGIASFIKAVLCVHHGEIVPSLNFRQPNPALELETSPFYVAQKRETWTTENHPRRAGISSFGVGGTNVHTVIEQFEQASVASSQQSHYFIALSGKTQKSLSGLKAQLIDQLKAEPTLDLANIEHTLIHGRRHFEHKFSAICKSKDELLNQLSNTETNQVIEGRSHQEQNATVFMFPGQGSQYANMALELFNQNETFKAHLERCFLIADKYLPHPLKSYLFGENQAQLVQTHISQIAVFSVEYSLTKLWESWGIYPTAVTGHSLGEYAAAVTSGIFSLDDAIMLISWRGRLMSELPPGSMISVALPAVDINPVRCDGVVIAALNGPQQTVLSGDVKSINNQKRILLSNGIPFKDLKTSHAFHSPMMEGMLSQFKEKIESVEFKKPRVPFISTLTGSLVKYDTLCTSQYWLDQIKQPVQFDKAIKTISSEYQPCLFIEVGPGTTLSSLTKSILQNPRIAFSCLPVREQAGSEFKEICYLRSLLWHNNAPCKRPEYSHSSRSRMISLLGTVFDTQSYWIEGSNAAVDYSARRTAPANALSVGLEVTLPDSECISESQSKELEKLQQKLIKDVKSLFQGKEANFVPLILDKGALSNVETELTETDSPVNSFVNRITDTEYVPPSSEVEIFLINIWQSLFGYQPAGINDNFFAVGGDSLTATTMLKNVSKEFEISISFKDIAENQTISELAKAVELRMWLKGNSRNSEMQEDTERFEI